MKKLFSQEEYEATKSSETLPLKCYVCGRTFWRRKIEIKRVEEGKGRKTLENCSPKCACESKVMAQIVKCNNCGVEFLKYLNQIKKAPNHFCCQSCAASYNNSHKTYGIRRPKFEKYVEERLTNIFPDLSIIYNDRETLGLELDVYIPSLKVAFEFNGIFHTEPVFGEDKLMRIQRNDRLRVSGCLEKGIELVVIDTSRFKVFSEKEGEIYLGRVVEKVNDLRGLDGA